MEFTGNWESLEDEQSLHEVENQLGIAPDDSGNEDEDVVVEYVTPEVFCCDTSGSNVNSTNVAAVVEAYLSSLRRQSSLHIAAVEQVTGAYTNKGEFGLFSMFFTRTLRERLRKWTSDTLVSKGLDAATENEFNAYLGLELAMSICPLNAIPDYWSERRFLGQSAFIETMPRTRFQQLRGALTLHPSDYTSFDKVRDPLWRARYLLQHFQQRFAEFAAPCGVSTIDEMSVRTKARTRAKTYMASKPDKYGLRFYAVTDWHSLYVHSIWDNGSGNSTPTTPAERYKSLFPSLRTPLYRAITDNVSPINPKSATVLWIAMVGHQSRVVRSPSGCRLVVSDNFYTRHTFARAVLRFTDNEMHLLGTVRLNLVDRWNKPALTESVARVAAGGRGSWELVAAVDPEPDWEKKEVEHKKAQHKKKKHIRTKSGRCAYQK